MRVICVNTIDFLNESTLKPSGDIAVHRGSVYHVTGSTTGQELKKEYPFAKGARDGKWYQLLEVPGYHHESHFLEIPEDEVETVQEEKALLN